PGDGKKKILTEEGNDKELLWALRGGGGMSYGIVTEFVIKTFPLPKHTVKFNVVWKDSPALAVLKLWENLIAPDQNINLLGTNLKIVAKPTDEQVVEESIHECVFYGYYAGTKEELEVQMDKWFAKLKPTERNILPEDRQLLKKVLRDKNNKKIPTAWNSFAAWDRINPMDKLKDNVNDKKLLNVLKEVPAGFHYIPPDLDMPAPHRITSRLVREQGLGDE